MLFKTFLTQFCFEVFRINHVYIRLPEIIEIRVLQYSTCFLQLGDSLADFTTKYISFSMSKEVDGFNHIFIDAPRTVSAKIG